MLLGGGRSGKSRLAISLGRGFKRKAIIATLEPKDEEMKARVKRHKKERGKNWNLIEEPIELKKAIETAQGKNEFIVIDCITLWLSNLLLSGKSDHQIIAIVKNLCKILKKQKAKLVLVSNEVGDGLVPDNELSRRFRDLMGETNQLLAKASDSVYLLKAGIPILIKGTKNELI